MFKLIGFLLKIIVIFVGIVAISQLEYKGRKIETYAMELIQSQKVQEGIDVVRSTVKGKAIGTFKPNLDPSLVRTAKEKKVFAEDKEGKPLSEVSDSDREELQMLMEK